MKAICEQCQNTFYEKERTTHKCCLKCCEDSICDKCSQTEETAPCVSILQHNNVCEALTHLYYNTTNLQDCILLHNIAEILQKLQSTSDVSSDLLTNIETIDFQNHFNMTNEDLDRLEKKLSEDAESTVRSSQRFINSLQ